MSTLKEKFIWFVSHIVIKKPHSIVFLPCLVVVLFTAVGNIRAEFFNSFGMSGKGGIEQEMNIVSVFNSRFGRVDGLFTLGEHSHLGYLGSEGSAKISHCLESCINFSDIPSAEITDKPSYQNATNCEKPGGNFWSHFFYGFLLGIAIGMNLLLLIFHFIQHCLYGSLLTHQTPLCCRHNTPAATTTIDGPIT